MTSTSHSNQPFTNRFPDDPSSLGMALFDLSSTLAAMPDNSQRSKECIPYDPNAKGPTLLL